MNDQCENKVLKKNKCNLTLKLSEQGKNVKIEGKIWLTQNCNELVSYKVV